LRYLVLTLALAPAMAFAQADISLNVGGKNYQTSNQGQCKAAPQASIYGVHAALYSVSHNADGQSLNLSLWQPKDGAPGMLSLRVSTGSKRYVVDTVQGKTKRDTKGSGKATLEKSDAGGVIAIDAVAESGEKISGRIRCRSFGAIQAEGG
jgi:hypothetical protein